MGNKSIYVLVGFFFFVVVIVLILVPKLKPSPNTVFQNEATTTEELIGGDRDKHGCLIAAGYSWCEEKQKCLRVWEEGCGDITTLLAELDKATSGSFTSLSEEIFNWIGESGEVSVEGYSKTVYGTVTDMNYEINHFMNSEGFVEDDRNILDKMDPARGYQKEKIACLVSSRKSDDSTPLSTQSEGARDFIVKCGNLKQ